MTRLKRDYSLQYFTLDAPLGTPEIDFSRDFVTVNYSVEHFDEELRIGVNFVPGRAGYVTHVDLTTTTGYSGWINHGKPAPAWVERAHVGAQQALTDDTLAKVSRYLGLKFWLWAFRGRAERRIAKAVADSIARSEAQDEVSAA